MKLINKILTFVLLVVVLGTIFAIGMCSYNLSKQDPNEILKKELLKAVDETSDNLDKMADIARQVGPGNPEGAKAAKEFFDKAVAGAAAAKAQVAKEEEKDEMEGCGACTTNMIDFEECVKDYNECMTKKK